MDKGPGGTAGDDEDARLAKRVRRNRQVVFAMLAGWLVLVLLVVSLVYFT
ncbi:MAG TPA: hypothetical protein VL984_10930 [Acidimicrobiales bacterium]|nr:hypothetical protein [Acidimicrobiales bacterium]